MIDVRIAEDGKFSNGNNNPGVDPMGFLPRGFDPKVRGCL
jgi:hypothetical protein